VPDVPGAWRLHLEQPHRGYRFSLDAFLLADFVAAEAQGPLMDLGTGCGVVALLLARCRPQDRIVGLELQTGLVRLARQNVARNGLQHRVDMVQADMRQVSSLFSAGRFGTVVCNPPYRRAGHGRLNPNSEKAMARHELVLTLPQVLDAACHLLRRRGSFVLVYHPSRLAELCVGLDVRQLRPRRLRQVHPDPQAPASMVLVEAIQGGRQALTALPPLFICDTDGRYSTEMADIFRGRARRDQHGESRGSHG
jgi:tRNA1Val (adenine37-N6)-methyltransferase